MLRYIAKYTTTADLMAHPADLGYPDPVGTITPKEEYRFEAPNKKAAEKLAEQHRKEIEKEFPEGSNPHTSLDTLIKTNQSLKFLNLPQ